MPTEVIDINKLATELQSLNVLIAKFDEPNINSNQKVNYFASLKKIDTTSIKEIGGKIKTRTKTIKKRKASGRNLTKRQRL
jgi:hypothetical protein